LARHHRRDRSDKVLPMFSDLRAQSGIVQRQDADEFQIAPALHIGWNIVAAMVVSSLMWWGLIVAGGALLRLLAHAPPS
jgi:hypothetical protein